MFSTNEIRGYGFWSPTAISGSTEVQLYYLASGNDLLDKINSGLHNRQEHPGTIFER